MNKISAHTYICIIAKKTKIVLLRFLIFIQVLSRIADLRSIVNTRVIMVTGCRLSAVLLQSLDHLLQILKVSEHKDLLLTASNR